MSGPRPGESEVARRSEREDGQPTVGQLAGEVGSDLQRLVRQELELARAEIRAEAAGAGKAVGMLGGGGFAGYMVALLLSLAAMFGLDNYIGLGWSALVVAGAWALIAAVLLAAGRWRMKSVSPRPEHTIESLKEDARWVRHRRR